MREIIVIMIGLFIFSGCIFTPPTNSIIVVENPSGEVRQASFQNPLIEIAKAQLGTPYRYGGMNPSGFDCSGFVCYVYEEAVGKKLPRTARAQSQYVYKMNLEDLEPGDLLFFDTSHGGKINHTGIYLGEGKFIHASSGKVYAVTISSLKSGFYQRAFRFGGRVAY